MLLSARDRGVCPHLVLGVDIRPALALLGEDGVQLADVAGGDGCARREKVRVGENVVGGAGCIGRIRQHPPATAGPVLTFEKPLLLGGAHGRDRGAHPARPFGAQGVGWRVMVGDRAHVRATARSDARRTHAAHAQRDP